MVDIINVTKRFDKFTAISNLSIHVESGSVYGLVGYNGAGKTTLLKTVAGIYKPEEGSVKILGENVFDNAAVKQQFFYVPDDLYFEPYSSMTKMAKFYAGYYPNFNMDLFYKLSSAFELDPKARINGFSKGMQRQAEMILGMATQPKILLLDESFDGLDPAKRNMMKKMILEYVAETGCTIIVSSHNLHELADISDRVGLINGKKIVMDCDVNQMSENRCKYRLVFDKEMNAEDFPDLVIKQFSKDSKIITLSLEGKPEDIEEKLKAYSPIMIDKLQITLEEIFLEEMEGANYDFKEIFS